MKSIGGSEVTFACDVEIKVPIAGVLINAFYEISCLATKILQFEFWASILSDCIISRKSILKSAILSYKINITCLWATQLQTVEDKLNLQD